MQQKKSYSSYLNKYGNQEQIKMDIEELQELDERLDNLKDHIKMDNYDKDAQNEWINEVEQVQETIKMYLKELFVKQM